ncbi:TipJ family phage tail tip protein [Cupriavidus metallidurans]|uniref:TipJ family phage tail tip protein n=1 Tax=Cupriavidus metallidurans TaxID=119219 RepID=UPI001F2C18FE|nr:phage tail protein [Cupriavidus metallidurans]
MKQKKLDKVRHDIVGFGGMGGKGGGGGGIVEAKDSIRSRQIASLIDIISEGPISGIVGGLEGIFFNETPVLNHDGSPNFYNMRADWRVGTPDQAPVPGFNGVESEVSVSVMVRADMPVTRSITNPDVDTVRVTVAVSGLTTQDTKTGDIKGARVDYEIWLQCNGGGYKRSVAAAFDAKTTSRTQRAHLIQVPRGSGPWDVRVIRVTPDNSASNINDKLYWDSFTQIISDQLIYPNSAYVAERVDSSQFNSIPSRAYHIKGLIIQVPSNYNPETRAYAGTWDGSFKPAYSNNPAWCFYDLIVNDRYGLGEHIRPEMMDKWALYQIAQYCDELVPNAAGGMEPRFTCNLYLQTQEEALTVLQNMASIFRAIVFWSGGTVVANQDRVKLPVAQFTNANIESGKFVYSDSSARQRATVVMVTWNDPANMYRQTIELVQDDDSVKRYGIIKREVVAFGCTSRGQARRYGKWLLLTERYENETITFTTGLEGCEAFPGAVIETSDAFRAGARFGGRLAAATATELTLDSELTLAVGHTHWISVVRPSDGLTVRAAITNPPGTYTTIAVPDLGFVPDKDSVWLSGGSDVTPEMWRIMGAREAGKNRVEITALQYNPSKFDAADRDAPMEVPTTSTIKTVPDTPTNLQFIAARYVVEGTMVGIRGTLSWTGTAQSYDVRYRRASGSWETRTVTQATMDINNIAIDVYTFEVIARNILCRSSTPASLVVSVNPGPIALPDVTGLVLDGAFTSNALKFKWNGVPGATSYEVRLTANASGLVAKRVKVGDSLHYTWTAAEMRQAGGPWRSVKVEVRALGALGAESAWATVLASNPQVGAMGSIQVDGGIKAIYVQATKPDDGDFAGMIVWAGATPGFVVNDASKVYDGVDTFVTINKIAGQQLDTGTYYVRIAGYDDFGKDSLTVSSAIAANVQSAVPGPNSITELMIQNGALTVAKFAQGIEPVGTVATLPSTAGYTGPKVVLNTTDGKLYRLVNNTWTRAVDGTDLSGGTVDATKFASGIEPVGLVTTLPNPSGYTGPKVVLNQTDGKTYRLVGGAWKKDVDAADIAGQLQAGQIASGAVDATKFASGIEPVTNVTTVPSVKSTSTVFNTTDGKLYRWNGTSYVATVPATDVSGQIAAAQIAAGAVDATKMASGIEPVSIVSKLPTTKSTTTIVNSADGKLYRWNGTAYVSTVDAVDVTGQITAAQLASGAVTTAKFAAGIEPVATVTGVPATKQTSTVFNTVDNKLYRWNGSAYVATVPTTDLTGQISAGQLAPGVVDSTKFANGVEPVTLVTVVPTTKSTSTVFNTVDGKLYRWNGTAYIATVPTVDLSGLISTAQIAAGAIDSTKLASGLEAVTIVSKLPTVKSTSNVFNTADSKLYRWNGSAYVASVAATDIAGQITADQIAAGTVDQTKFASDIEAVSLVSALPTKKSTNTVFNTADNKLYRWNGTAYVSTVAATDITGTLASAQIAAGAVDATKLASGIEPITVVTAVPGTKSTTTIYNSTDGKLYRWTTSGYVSSVPATDITGQLQAAQIAVGAIDTTKLASGIEPVTVVTTIPSTKKTSAVFNSTDGKLYSWTGTKYVCTVDATDISGQISASQIAAGVIDATKLAAGIEPVAVVSGLPGTKKTSTVFNSLDNKLYRWDGTRYVSTVDAVDITGQLTAAQLANGAVDATKFASGIEPVTNVATVPSTKSTSTIYNTTDKKIYRWNGSAYVASVAATDVSGQISEAQVAAGAIDSTKLASGIEAVSIVSTLPSSAGYTGPKTVFNTADGKLYRYFAGGWVSTVNTADLDGTISSAQIAGIAASKVTGQLTDAQVAAVAAAKITGTIGATQISDGAISTPKLAAGAVTAAQIAANTITASQLAAGAVTATTLSAGAVTTAKIAAGAVTATELAAGSVTAAKVAANAVTAGAIAADAVTAGTIAAAAITSREVAANAITTDKILVGNFSNLIPNGDLETGTLANWRPYAGQPRSLPPATRRFQSVRPLPTCFGSAAARVDAGWHCADARRAVCDALLHRAGPPMRCLAPERWSASTITRLMGPRRTRSR